MRVPTVINGLPAHILLIHVVIVLVPLGALFTVLSAVWPAARLKLGFISPLTCLIALVFVPITTNAGLWLKHHIHASGELAQKIQKHQNLATGFVWYALGLFAVSTAVWWIGRNYEIRLWRVEHSDTPSPVAGGTGGGTATATRTETRTSTKVLPQWASIVLAAASVVMSVLIVWQLYRIGDAGSRSVWGGIVSN
jgi:hypothetical protein